MNTSGLSQVYKNKTKAYIGFFTLVDNNLQILLCKPPNKTAFEIPNTTVLHEDSASTFAITRLMISEYLGILTQKNLAKLYNGELLVSGDIRTNPLKWYEYPYIPDYDEWCETISSHNVIQFDDIEDSRLYLIEIKEFNVSLLNKSLEDLGVGFSFTFYNYREKSVEGVESSSINLINSFDIPNYINSTKDALEKDEVSYFIILSIKEASTSAKDQAGFFHFPSLFQGLYKQNKEKWVLYCAGGLVFPSDDQLKKTKAILIPGSALNLYNNIPFIPQTCEWIKYVHNNYPSIKVLGVCFGEQLICYTFGGVVDMLEQKKKDKSYFVRFPTPIIIQDDFWEIPFVKNSGVPPKKEYIIMQAHGDEVVSHPDWIKNYASSDSCQKEVLVSLDHRYFLVQGHPEYIPEFNLARAFRFLTGGKITEPEEIEKFFEKLKGDMKLRPDAEAWRGLCFSFLKN